MLEPGVVPPQVQDFALPLAEVVGAPALAGHEPGAMPRAAPSRDSVREEGFGRPSREAAPGSVGCQESRTPGPGGRGCGGEEERCGETSSGARAGPGDLPAGNICPGTSCRAAGLGATLGFRGNNEIVAVTRGWTPQR